MAAWCCRRRALAGGRHARTRRGECFAPSARPPTESLTPEAGWRRVPSGTTRVRPCCCSLWPARARRLVPSGLPPCPLRRSRQAGCHCEYAECPNWSLPAGGPPPSALGRASSGGRADSGVMHRSASVSRYQPPGRRARRHCRSATTRLAPSSLPVTTAGYTLAARTKLVPPTDRRSIQNITLAVYKIRVLQGQRPNGRAARSHPRLQGTSILLGQPWPRAAAIAPQVPKGFTT